MEKNKCKILLSALLLISLIPVYAQQLQRSSTPNIVIIFCDDMGYGDIAEYGASLYSTPNLDQMAAHGMRFTNFYAGEAICSASRAALLTGCYPNRIGIHDALMPHSKIGLSDKEMTIANLVKQKNYATAIFGKWHLGDEEKFLPLQHGFDQWFGLPYSNDMWPVGFDGKPITDSSNWRIQFPPLFLYDGNKPVKEIKNLDDQATLTTIYTEHSVDFIRKNKNKPFFLYLAESMPHVPIAVSDKFKGKSKQGLYGDVIMELDWSVGQVIKALKENGLEKNTLVVFASDNGPWLCFGDHAGSAGGLREGKATAWDGGQKEPCIMYWPGVIPAGTVCNQLSSAIDLFPTIAQLTGTKLPDHKIDGVNILPLMKGEKDAEPRKSFYYYLGINSLEGVRDNEFKLVLPHKGRTYEGFAPGNGGYPGQTDEQHYTGLALYDLRRDPGERYNVLDTYPKEAAKLQQIAEQVREDLGDDLTGRKGTGRREPGKR